jgi:hypothetical protein
MMKRPLCTSSGPTPLPKAMPLRLTPSKTGRRAREELCQRLSNSNNTRTPLIAPVACSVGEHTRLRRFCVLSMRCLALKGLLGVARALCFVLIFLRFYGAGDGIRTHDPNLGKVVHQCSADCRSQVEVGGTVYWRKVGDVIKPSIGIYY